MLVPVPTSSSNPTLEIIPKAISANIFQPVASGPPPSQFPLQWQHFVQRNKVTGGTALHTNKFYTNLLVGSQRKAIFTHPYSMWFRDCKDSALPYCGISISHIDREKVAYEEVDPSAFFMNPLGIESIILSALELGYETQLLTTHLAAFSINAHLSSRNDIAPVMSLPIVQGMGFITAVYTNASPIISTGVFFRSLVFPLEQPGRDDGVWKYRVMLRDESVWLVYIRSNEASTVAPALVLQGSTKITGPTGFSGTIQIAKLPASGIEAVYDLSAGVYALKTTVEATASGSEGSYTLQWTKDGLTDRSLLMFALPHHVESMDSASKARLTPLKLQTTTKGLATATLADSVTMIERHMPTEAGFGPYSPFGMVDVPPLALRKITQVVRMELAQNMTAQTDLTSMYFSGKGFAKFAMAIVTANQIGDTDVAAAGLNNLTTAFSIFVDNRQRYPMVYETTWRGLVSSGSYITNEALEDFGNTYYNDHHFHYGYFVYTAAVIAYYDSSWLTKGNNKAWVDSLVRDYANSVEDDEYFPFSRSFDWFHGHSWADGLFESGDGKNEESTSEDSFSLYAIKMWGLATKDANMEARGNLQLAILRRSLQNYFLLESSNQNQPAQFIDNKAVGIMFENKIDHTTYFGSNIEYIEGIHMLPLHAVSPYMRSPTFVREEWATYFSDGRADAIPDGAWRGILYANLALIDPRASWDYFSKPDFDLSTLDGGASLSWYLLLTAVLGGVPTDVPS